MTTSRSRASRHRLLAALVVLCAIVGAGGVAQAGRKRVVVLDFEGPKGAKFHDDLVKLIKKTHTVVPTEKWNGTAEEMDASAVSEKNIKKVARKLKVDAIVEGKIVKRRDEFIIRLKLHEGRSGELIGNTIDTKADGPRIDGRAQRDLKDELVEVIGNVASNHLGSTSDDVVGPSVKKPAKQTDEDADDRPVKKGFSRHADAERGSDKVENTAAKTAAKKPAKTAAAGEDKPPVKKLVKKTDDEDDDEDDDDDELPAKQTDGEDERRGNQAVASSDDEAEAGQPLDAATALSPGERALDAVLGLSVTARRLSFAIRPGLLMRPPAYKGTPVGGAMIEATVYPLAVGHKRTDQWKNLGLNVMYDRVFKVNSKDATGKVFASTEARYGVGGVFRHAFNRTAMAPVVIGSLGYSRQAFEISSGTTIGIPSVKYSIVEPGAGLRYPITAKLTAGIDAKFMLITSAGQIETAAQYGPGTVLGVEGALGADYLITPSLFVRAAFRGETIGFTFKGTGTLSNLRDGDPTTTDVPGARDSYIGGMATVGYLY